MKFLKFWQGIFFLFLLSVAMAVPVLAADQPSLRQTDAAGNEVTLSWDRRDDAVSYEIYYKYAAQGTYHFLERLDTPEGHPVVRVNLPKAGRKYQVKIVPYDEDGVAGTAYELPDCVTLPGKISLRSQKSLATSQSMKIYWTDMESALGYEFLVQSLDGRFAKRYQAEKKSSAVLDNIPPGKFYRMRLRGYTRVNGKSVYGTASYTYIAQQPRVKFKWASHSAVLASWEKVEGAAEYTVYLSDNPARGFRKVKTVTNREAAIPGLSRNRKYYVYVVAKMRRGKAVYVTPKTNHYTFRLQAE